MRGRDLGMVFQEPLTRLNPLMRISDHFAETLKTRNRSISKSEIDRRSLEVLRLMGIATRYRAYPHEFSGGMRQRLMIALTLVLRPAFVVADEPTTALDVLVEAQIIRILDLRSNYRTALLITHNLGIIAEACDRVAVMYARRSSRSVTPASVLRPKHPYTRELLRSTISLRTTGLNYTVTAPRTWSSRRRSATSTRAAPTRCRSARPGTPSSASTRGHPGPVLGSRLQGRPGGVAPSPNAHRSSGRRSPLPTKPEVDRLSGPRSDTVLDIEDLAVHLPGSRAAPWSGPEGAQRQGRRRRHRVAEARRGARHGRRVGQRQVHVRPRAARPGAGTGGSPTTRRTAGSDASPEMRGAERAGCVPTSRWSSRTRTRR